MMKQMAITAALMIRFSSAAFAQATCSMSGPTPDPVDANLAPKIIAWAGKVENYLHLSPPTTKAAALKLQAFTAGWLLAAQQGSLEAIFREAVGHGINAQIEKLLMTVEPFDAKKHQFWADTEAARAAACLVLIQLP